MAILHLGQSAARFPRGTLTVIGMDSVGETIVGGIGTVWIMWYIVGSASRVMPGWRIDRNVQTKKFCMSVDLLTDIG